MNVRVASRSTFLNIVFEDLLEANKRTILYPEATSAPEITSPTLPGILLSPWDPRIPFGVWILFFFFSSDRRGSETNVCLPFEANVLAATRTFLPYSALFRGICRAFTNSFVYIYIYIHSAQAHAASTLPLHRERLAGRRWRCLLD